MYFDNDEMGILSMLDTDRLSSIRTLEEQLDNDASDELIHTEEDMIQKLNSMSDAEFAYLNTDGFDNEILDIAFDNFLIQKGIMDEDGMILKEVSDAEMDKLQTEFNEKLGPPTPAQGRKLDIN